MTMQLIEGLTIIGEADTTFEREYITVREKEGRVYSNRQVAKLPYPDKSNAHYSEWMLRAKSMERFLRYLQKNHVDSSLLEIGCGNGWFSFQCSKYVQDVCGIDVNLTELKQAATVFQANNLQYYYWDIFSESPFKNQFDCIVLNAVVQYFEDFNQLLNRLKELLHPQGEIHIIDSPFYTKPDLAHARKRTHDYFSGMGVPKMASHYFHHDIKLLKGFNCLHKPPNKLLRLFRKDSPFGWYRYT